MRAHFLNVLVVLSAAASAGGVVRFGERAGETPAGWTYAQTGGGEAPRWSVVADETAPGFRHVLAQLSEDAVSSRYPLAIYDAFTAADGRVSVKFKAVSGKIDRAAGVVWRYRDPGNYYIVRANALEDNVVLYKVEGGKRTPISPVGMPPGTYGVKRAVPAGRWCELAVEFQGDAFTVFFDGERLFEVRDATFSGPGKTGVWTKADSVTYFEEFAVAGR